MTIEDRLLMQKWGTMRWQPSAPVILQTARNSLLEARESARARDDRREARKCGAQSRYQAKPRKGAFLAIHLRNAKSASDVLRNAIKGIGDAAKSKDVETLYIYQSQAHLEEALRLAIAEENAATAGGSDIGPGSGQADWLGNAPGGR